VSGFKRGLKSRSNVIAKFKVPFRIVQELRIHEVWVLGYIGLVSYRSEDPIVLQPV